MLVQTCFSFLLSKHDLIGKIQSSRWHQTFKIDLLFDRFHTFLYLGLGNDMIPICWNRNKKNGHNAIKD
jgi:hypothetical protein